MVTSNMHRSTRWHQQLSWKLENIFSKANTSSLRMVGCKSLKIKKIARTFDESERARASAVDDLISYVVFQPFRNIARCSFFFCLSRSCDAVIILFFWNSIIHLWNFLFLSPSPSLCLCEVPPDAQLTPEQTTVLYDALAKAKEKLHRLTTDHRDLHGAVSKIGKTIDRNFVSDFSSTTRNDVLVHEQNIQLLNKVIAQHFQRNNMNEVATTLIKESNLPAEDMVSDPFSDLHRIWEAIFHGDLKEALDWAEANEEKLQMRHSSLEFKLHRIAFLQVSRSREVPSHPNLYSIFINWIDCWRIRNGSDGLSQYLLKFWFRWRCSQRHSVFARCWFIE